MYKDAQDNDKLRVLGGYYSKGLSDGEPTFVDTVEDLEVGKMWIELETTNGFSVSEFNILSDANAFPNHQTEIPLL